MSHIIKQLKTRDKKQKQEGLNLTISMSLLNMSKVYYCLATRPGYNPNPIKFEQGRPKGPLLWKCYEDIGLYTKALIGERRNRMPTVCCARILMKVGKRSMAIEEYTKAEFCFLNALCIRSHYYSSVSNADIVESYFFLGYVYLEMKNYNKSLQAHNRIQEITNGLKTKSKYYDLLPLWMVILNFCRMNINEDDYENNSLDIVLKNVRDRLECCGLSEDMDMLNIIWKKCRKDITKDDTFWYHHMIPCDECCKSCIKIPCDKCCKSCIKKTFENQKCDISLRFINNQCFDECD